MLKSLAPVFSSIDDVGDGFSLSSIT